MVAGSEHGGQFYATQILDLVLTCVGHHDYEVNISKMYEFSFNIIR